MIKSLVQAVSLPPRILPRPRTIVVSVRFILRIRRTLSRFISRFITLSCSSIFISFVTATCFIMIRLYCFDSRYLSRRFIFFILERASVSAKILIIGVSLRRKFIIKLIGIFFRIFFGSLSSIFLHSLYIM